MITITPIGVIMGIAVLLAVLIIDLFGIIARGRKEVRYLRERVRADWEELAALRTALGYGPTSAVCFNDGQLVKPPLVRAHEKAKNRIAQLDKDMCKFGCSLTDCRRRIMIWEDAPPDPIAPAEEGAA